MLSQVATLLVVGAPGAGPGAERNGDADLTVRVTGGPAGIGEYLTQRAHEAWKLNARLVTVAPGEASPLDDASASEPAAHGIDARRHHLQADIVWQVGDQVSVTVSDGELVLSSRTIEPRDVTEAKLMLWLLLKSTLGRALIGREVGPEPAGAERARAGAPSIERSSPPEPGAAPDAISAPTSSPSGAAAEVPITSPEPRHAAVGARQGADVRDAPAPQAVAFGSKATAWLETPRLFAVGIAAVVTWTWRFLALGLQLGYRFTPGPSGLTVHGLPLTATAAIETGDLIRAGLGAFLSGEVKIPVSGAQSSMQAGSEGGLLAQAAMGITEHMAVSLRFALAWRLVRMRYVYVDGGGLLRHTREAPWTSLLAVGVAWR